MTRARYDPRPFITSADHVVCSTRSGERCAMRRNARLRRQHVDVVVVERGVAQMLPAALLGIAVAFDIVFPGEQLTQPRHLLVVLLALAVTAPA